MSKQDTLLVGVSVSLGVLVLGALGVGGYVLLKEKAAPTQPVTTAPGSAQPGLVVGNGVVAPVGSSSGWDAVKQLQEREAAREAEWRKADKLQTLERDWATLMNDIKLTAAEIDKIDASPVPADIVMEASRQHVQDCWRFKNSGFHPFFNPEGCNHLEGDNGKWKKLAEDLWAARQAELKVPLLAKVDLQGRQMASLIDNFAELGVTKQRVALRTS